MPTIDDLAKLEPIRSNFKSDAEFRRLSDLWEDHIAPVIVELKRMAGTKPQPSSFEDSEDFEEAFGFWMGRQGRVISMRLSEALRRWQSLSRSDDG
jgi:hypothetical protein